MPDRFDSREPEQPFDRIAFNAGQAARRFEHKMADCPYQNSRAQPWRAGWADEDATIQANQQGASEAALTPEQKAAEEMYEALDSMTGFLKQAEWDSHSTEAHVGNLLEDARSALYAYRKAGQP